MAETVKVWDARKGRWVEVAIDSNAARGIGHGVTVKPVNTSTVDIPYYVNPNATGPIPTGPYIPSSIGVTPGGPSVQIVPQPNQPGGGGTFDNKGNRVVSVLGMTSPGDPRGAYRARPEVKAGETGDELTPDATPTLAEIWASILNPSATSGTSGSKPTLSRAALKKALIEARNEISKAYDTASSTATSALSNNPYADFQAQANTVDPGLSAFFESQGVSSNPLEQLVASNREAAGQRGAAMNDLYKLLAGQFDQQAAQQQAYISQQRASTLDELMQNYSAILGSGKVY